MNKYELNMKQLRTNNKYKPKQMNTNHKHLQGVV